MIRFCCDCHKESTETTWSDYWRTRLCMDCYNIRCEATEADYANEYDCAEFAD